MVAQVEGLDLSLPVVASVSGGKDSAALSLYLTEQGIEHRRVFFDTGWEHEATYAYIDGPLTDKLGLIERVKGPLGLPALMLKKGMFPTRVRRFCTQELKISPFKKWVVANYGKQEIVNAVGIRAEESEARANMPELTKWQDVSTVTVWRPLIRWTEQEVIDIHKRHDLVPNPLYLRGARRVGCWPCIFSRKSDLAMLSEERIQQIELLEQAVEASARKRYAERGESFESLGYEPPRMFMLRKDGVDCMVPIREAVEWAKTDYGGKQYKLFETDDPGCARWGMCE